MTGWTPSKVPFTMKMKSGKKQGAWEGAASAQTSENKQRRGVQGVLELVKGWKASVRQTRSIVKGLGRADTKIEHGKTDEDGCKGVLHMINTWNMCLIARTAFQATANNPIHP